MTRRDIILVGLSGSGKSTIGRMVAAQLGGSFLDIDSLIEARYGTSISHIFRDRGEAEFRRAERERVAEVLAQPGAAVVAPGAGWAAQPGNLESAGARGMTVYLATSPAVAAGRTAGTDDRPLLREEDREVTIRELLEVREHYYASCDATVPTDARTPEEVAASVVELARNSAGW